MGAPCNICIPPDTHANISRINPDGSGFEYFAQGVRNSVGFDFHPVTKELYFTNHGRDWLGDDVPHDTSTTPHGPACTSAIRTATRATSSIPTSASATRAATSPRRC